ncbi:hypothetical protein KC878_01135 [Candidatus Saccharibacteria bacterium]|nr:hypothetical protein [Candidatus Saccharibacteria bacterium]MCB9821167.1 hypothetical protein [Candidatus Nomurabacteria bacterium]
MKSEPKLWFKAKRYGWGWRPVSKEGWLVTVIFAGYLGVIGVGYGRVAEKLELIDTGSGSLIWLTALYFTSIAGSVAGLICLIRSKSEKPGWRWGNKK